MSRYVNRMPSQPIQLRPQERYWWPIGSSMSYYPNYRADRLIYKNKWKAARVKGDYKNSTEYAVVNVLAQPYRLVERTWKQGGYQYYEQETLVSTQVRDDTPLGGVFYRSGGWVICPSYVLELCATTIAGKAAKSRASLLAAAAESLETARFIVDKVALLTALTKMALAGNWKGFRRTFRQAYGDQLDRRIRTKNQQNAADGTNAPAAGELEWQYAMHPLISETEGLFDLYNGSLKKYGTSFMVITTYGGYNRSYSGGASPVEVDAEIAFRSKAVYAIDQAQLAGLALIGVTDVPGAAWEVTRYSVFVDWLIPVGDWMSSMTPLLGLDLVDAYVGALHTEIHRQPPEVWGGRSYTKSPIILEGMSRTKIDVRAHLIVKNPFSLDNMVTTAALIKTLNKRM